MRNKTIAFVANFSGIFLFGISMVMIGSILPLLKIRFGIGDAEAGGLFSILPVGLLIGSVAFGPIVDKFNYRWTLFFATLFLSAGFFGIAHATSLDWLRISIFLFGLGGGTINGGTSALVSDLSEGKQKIINLNWLGMFYGIGAFSMPLILSLVSERNHVLIIDVVSLLSLIIAVGFLFIDYPIVVEKDKISIKLIPKFLKNRFFMVICFYLFFQSAFEALVNNWTVSFFMETLGSEQNQALWALSVSILGLVSMRLLIGSALRDWHHFGLVRLSLLLFATGVVLLFTPAFIFVKMLGMYLIGAGLASGFPVMLGIIGEIFKGVSGTAFSFAMLIALVGNTIINYLTGLVTQLFGMSAYLYVVTAVAVMMSAVFFNIRRMGRGDWLKIG